MVWLAVYPRSPRRMRWVGREDDSDAMIQPMWPGLSTTLTGELVVLEPLMARHADGLRAAAADPRISTWFPAALHEPAGFDAWLAVTLDAARSSPA